MKVLFLTEGTEVPASRYRAQMLLPHFERLGIQCTLKTGYGDSYNRLHATRLGGAYKLLCRLKRAAWTLVGGRYDAVFLQRTAIPHTALPEQILARLANRIVFDFDDAIYLGPSGVPSRLRARAFHAAVDASAWVVAGNQHLAVRARAASKTTVIPTCLDVGVYRPSVRQRGAAPIVGWMGTAGNLGFLREVIPSVLAAVGAVEGAKLRIVSNQALEELRGHPRVEQLPWSAASEVETLQSFDIGLMPLQDSELTKGKCGFKMLQYMAVGCSVIASDVGANREIFEGSGAGMLMPAGTLDWSGAVARLLDDAGTRDECGRAGRARVAERYSAEGAARQYVDVFQRIARVS